MNGGLWPLLLPMIVSFMVVLVAAPALRRLAGRLGIVDRSAGSAAGTPLLGGVAILGGWGLSMLLFGRSDPHRAALLAGAGAVCAIGLIDDAVGLGPVKLLFELGVAAVTVIGVLHPPLSWSLSLLAIVGMTGVMNALNTLDSADGSAAVIALGMLAGLGVLGFLWGGKEPTVVGGLAGAVLAFLLFNLPPALQFMGDAGSKLLGFLVSVVALRTLPGDPAGGDLVAVGLVMALPVVDFVLVHVRRIPRYGRDLVGLMMSRGHDHLPHRLVAAGFTPVQALLAEGGLQLAAIPFALISIAGGPLSFVAAGGLVLGIVLVEQFLLRRQRGTPFAPVQNRELRVWPPGTRRESQP